MAYIDSDGSKKQPIMIHRAIFGSLERFFGILVENYAGKIINTISNTVLQWLAGLTAVRGWSGNGAPMDSATASATGAVGLISAVQLMFDLPVGNHPRVRTCVYTRLLSVLVRRHLCSPVLHLPLSVASLSPCVAFRCFPSVAGPRASAPAACQRCSRALRHGGEAY
jgi:hypothetical protein